MHKPVLLEEVLAFAGETQPLRVLDCTFGRGGHTNEFLRQFPEASVTALDRDGDAVNFGRERFANEVAAGRMRLLHQNFHQAQTVFDEGDFDVILLDLGVSSPQLDVAERGFSFYHEGPLDMRMDRSQGATAADLVNTWSEAELAELFVEYGEVRRPHRVVGAIVKHRREKAFATTRELSGLIEQVEGWHKKGHHPATRYFLALRMAVNNELSGLKDSIPDLMRALSPKGRLIVITFHSLEDRIIKYAFKEAREWGYPLTKKVVVPSREEMLANPRARSAKLRVFQREVGHHDSSTPAGDSSVF